MAEEDARRWVRQSRYISFSLGNAPGNQFIPHGQARKARLRSGSVKRIFSAGLLLSYDPGALPQALM
jgi:hypothetical protein